MLGILFIVGVAVVAVFLQPVFESRKKRVTEEDKKNSVQLNKLWKDAQDAMKNKRTLRAESTLLRILKLDETNAAAYNRLGVLYAREQKYDEAIECFEIAQSLDNSASSVHNVGLIYLKTGAYEKAEMAFLQALRLDDKMAARYIALSKAQEELGKRKQAIESLEKAYELDQKTSTLRQILALHEAAGDAEAITATTARIEKQMVADARKKAEATKARMRKAASSKSVVSRTPKIIYPKAKVVAKPVKTRTTRKAASGGGAKVAQGGGAAKAVGVRRAAPKAEKSAATTSKTKTVAVRNTSRSVTVRGTSKTVRKPSQRRKKVIQ